MKFPPKTERLPKQVRHWFRKNKIKIDHVNSKSIYGRSRDPRRFGFNRRFRMIVGVGFQISDTDFDRWANSVLVTYDIPLIEADFNTSLDQVFFEEYPDLGAVHIDIEQRWTDCECCGYSPYTTVSVSNGDEFFYDGHFGSRRGPIDFYWCDDTAQKRFTELYRARGYKVRVTERFAV